jgi:hypothetical protein
VLLAVGDGVQGLLQPSLGVGGDRFEFGSARDADHDLRVKGCDQGLAVVVGADDDVPRQ